MGKNPSFPFYPGDWTRDLDDQDLEIEGAWIRICCRLWWMPERGKATKQIKEWSRILRKTEQKTIKIFQKLIEKGIASGEVLDNQTATIINRRMANYDRISKIRQEVGKLGGNPKLAKSENNLDNQKPNQKRPSSFSFSSSSSKKNTYSPEFNAFYAAYPKKRDPDRAWKAWQGRNGDRPDISVLLEAIKNQSQTPDWKKEKGQFIPYPATWLNAGSWKNEVEIGKSSEKPIITG